MKAKTLITRIKILAAGILALLILSGCSSYGSSVDTQLTVNKDLSGVRAMDVTITPSVFEENFHGDINALNAVIEAHCPDELAYTYSNTDGTDRYHVELAFESPIDYKAKVESIMGKEVKLEMIAPDSVWASGFKVTEDFSSTDLLKWLENALIDENLVDSDSAGYIFQSGTTKVLYNDTSYDTTGSCIQINTINYVSLDKMDVLTAVNGVDNFDRTYVLYIPRVSMSEKGDEIEAFINANVPAGTTPEWGAYENGSTVTVEGKGMDLKALNVFNQSFLTTEDNLIAISSVDSDKGIFSFVNSWKEDMDVSAYAGNENGIVYLSYYVKTADGILMSEAPNSDSYFYLYNDGRYPGYDYAGGGNVNKMTLEARLRKTYLIDHTDIHTTAKSVDDITRVVTLTMNETPGESELSQIVSRIQKRDSELTEVETAAGEEGFQIIISQTGSASDLSEVSEAVFGGSLNIQKASEGGALNVKKYFVFVESADLGEFLSGVTEDHSITYTAELGGLIRSLNKPSEGTEEILAAKEITRQAKGNSISYEISNATYYSIAESGYMLDPVAALIWGVMVLLTVVVIFGLVKTGVPAMAAADVKIKRQQSAVKRQQRAVAAVQAGTAAQAAAAAQAAMDQAAATQAQMYTAPDAAGGQEAAPSAFCPNCGYPNTSAALYCENCGTKLAD